MPLLQVRDFPGDIYALIKSKARQEHRTVSQQTVVLIKNGLGIGFSPRERRLQIMEEIKKMDIPKEAQEFDVIKSIQEDRNR